MIRPSDLRSPIGRPCESCGKPVTGDQPGYIVLHIADELRIEPLHASCAARDGSADIELLVRRLDEIGKSLRADPGLE